jgi:hypothetical protein
LIEPSEAMGCIIRVPPGGAHRRWLKCGLGRVRKRIGSRAEAL